MAHWHIAAHQHSPLLTGTHRYSLAHTVAHRHSSAHQHTPLHTSTHHCSPAHTAAPHTTAPHTTAPYPVALPRAQHQPGRRRCRASVHSGFTRLLPMRGVVGKQPSSTEKRRTGEQPRFIHTAHRAAFQGAPRSRTGSSLSPTACEEPRLRPCDNPDGCKQVSDELRAAPINTRGSSPYCPTSPA